jgi:segregation and condensation protein B
LPDRKRVIEALLFASQEPLTVARLQGLLDSEDRRGILEDLRAIQGEYAQMGRAFHLVEVAGGYQLRTLPEMGSWVRKLKRQAGTRMTQASLETLAIIAYKQPVTRAEVEYIRGVECGAVLRGLLERNLLKILGRKDVPGRPILYGTSRRFLEVFSLRDLGSLPDLREIPQIEELRPSEGVMADGDTDPCDPGEDGVTP